MSDDGFMGIPPHLLTELSPTVKHNVLIMSIENVLVSTFAMRDETLTSTTIVEIMNIARFTTTDSYNTMGLRRSMLHW
jgi:hypothetical protein